MKNVTLSFILFLCAVGVFAQNQDMDALRKDYPLLTERFSHDIESQRADYIFVVDVSGSMNKFEGVVVPALQNFFESLQKDDFVSVIKFGGEADNEIGSQGKITDETKRSLQRYSANLYNRPATESEKRRFYNNTDLANMLNYLADDMRQIGRNQLKFVFIITDFFHEPSSERKGKENWQTIKSRFEGEQKENDVYMFAMTLPGNSSGKDLDKVEAVIPKNFNFSIVNIPSQNALSEWFANKKNKILLDKFTNIIKRKNTPLNEIIDFSTEMNGNLFVNASWSENELFNGLLFEGVTVTDKRFVFDTRLPVEINNSGDGAQLGKITVTNKWLTCFKTFDSTVSINYRWRSQYMNELIKLGIVEQVNKVEYAPNKMLFLFGLPLWLTVILVTIIVLYTLLVFMAFARNRSSGTKISGRFTVDRNGVTIANQQIKNSNNVDIGKNGKTIRLDSYDCNWRVKIFVKRFTPLFLKKPVIQAVLITGRSMKIVNRKYQPQQKAKYSKHRMMTVEDQTEGVYIVQWR